MALPTDQCLSAISLTIKLWEGTILTNDPHDPGGKTKFGISQRRYPNEDIAALTFGRASELYRRDYWEAAHLDRLRWPLNAKVFDACVLMGVDDGIPLLQQCANLFRRPEDPVLKIDGDLGPVTAAFFAARNPIDVAWLYAGEMWGKLRNKIILNPDLRRYALGWARRAGWVPPPL